MLLFDIPSAYSKLASNEPLTEDEVVSLLKELEHFRCGVAYLASCQAATLESLPKSASKSGRRRHVTLCEAAAKILDGDGSPIRYPENMDEAKMRCVSAAANHHQ